MMEKTEVKKEMKQTIQEPFSVELEELVENRYYKMFKGFIYFMVFLIIPFMVSFIVVGGLSAFQVLPKGYALPVMGVLIVLGYAIFFIYMSNVKSELVGKRIMNILYRISVGRTVNLEIMPERIMEIAKINTPSGTWYLNYIKGFEEGSDIKELVLATPAKLSECCDFTIGKTLYKGLLVDVPTTYLTAVELRNLALNLPKEEIEKNIPLPFGLVIDSDYHAERVHSGILKIPSTIDQTTLEQMVKGIDIHQAMVWKMKYDVLKERVEALEEGRKSTMELATDTLADMVEKWRLTRKIEAVSLWDTLKTKKKVAIFIIVTIVAIIISGLVIALLLKGGGGVVR